MSDLDSWECRPHSFDVWRGACASTATQGGMFELAASGWNGDVRQQCGSCPLDPAGHAKQSVLQSRAAVIVKVGPNCLCLLLSTCEFHPGSGSGSFTDHI